MSAAWLSNVHGLHGWTLCMVIPWVAYSVQTHTHTHTHDAKATGCLCRQRYRGPNQRGGSRDRNDGFINRGSSADRLPRQPGNFDGSSDRSDQDRFGPRRNRDIDRSMGRGRRMDRPFPGREPVRPTTTSRQPSANSTVSASRGADGRIEIAAEPARVPSVAPPSSVSDATASSKLPAAKPSVQNSPTSPLPMGLHTDAAATSVPSTATTDLAAQHPGQPPAQAEPRMPAAQPSTSAAEPAAAQPAMPPADTTAAAQHQLSVTPPSLHPRRAEVPLVNNGMPHPSPSPHSPSSGGPSSQHPPQMQTGPRHPHVLPAVPNMAAANGPSTEAVAPQVPPHAAPLQQVPPFKPKGPPAPGVPISHLPNGYGPPQQPSGSLPSLPGLNGRSRPFTPQQPHIMQQPHHQHLQQQFQQQLPRRQQEKPSQMPYSIGPDPRQLQGPGMLPHMLSGQASPAEQAQSLAGQSRSMHQPQPGASRSSSIGQKRPMPNQDMPHHHAPPHQLASPQQQRAPPNPPVMPFNAPMMPFLSSPNGMPNGSMPQGPNGMPFLMQGSPRPGLMTGNPLMTPLNLAMGKSGPMHQHAPPPLWGQPIHADAAHAQSHQPICSPCPDPSGPPSDAPWPPTPPPDATHRHASTGLCPCSALFFR